MLTLRERVADQPMNHPQPPLSAHRLASRMSAIEPFHVVALVTRAKELEAQGRSIVNMVIGEPDFPTPQPIVRAGMEALASGAVRYTPSLGTPALREALSTWYRTRYGVDVPAARIVVTTGSSGALLLAMGVLLSPGDEVLTADPAYPANRHFVRAMEGEAVGIPVDAATGYQLTAELVERHWTPRTVGVMVASPSNPTGMLIPFDELQRIHRAVRRRGGVLIVDEIYHGLTYGCEARSALEFADDIFVINSFSKYFCMTGWRVGWMVLPQAYVGDVEKLAQNLYISNPELSMQAALAAFHPESLAECERNRAAFQAQRDFLLPELRKLGFEIPVTPQGAFYVYANCGRLTGDSYGFCVDLLENAGVAVGPRHRFRRAPRRAARALFLPEADPGAGRGRSSHPRVSREVMRVSHLRRDDLVSSGDRLLTGAVALLLAACQTVTVPGGAAHNVDAMEPAAITAAKERAQIDLGCGAATATVLSRDYPQNLTVYSVQRVVYRIEVQGCDRKTTFAVACVPNSPCSAMSESGVVERVK